MSRENEFDYDVLVIGSGFGGSVSALRLVEKGWKVAVLEQGRQLSEADFANAGEDPKALAWAPALGLKGFFAQDLFRHMGIVRGVGVGGGSLVYAAVLLEPREGFYRHPAWSSLSPDWQRELEPHYARARKMLGVADNPRQGAQDEWLRKTAARMGAGASYGTVPQGIFWGDPETSVADPYFQGAGPVRRGCNHCGRCITGCAQGAKNTLNHNYLYFARKLGVPVLPERKVSHVEPLPHEGYRVHLFHPWDRNLRYRPVTARKVILAAGVLGTLEILFASRDRYRTLPQLPRALGKHVRTNSEAIVGVLARNAHVDVTQGTTISSHFYPDDQTHVTQNRFPPSYSFMKFYMGPLVDGGGLPRAVRTLGELLRHPWQASASWRARNWYRRTTVLTVMQHADNEVAFAYGRRLLRGGRYGLVSRVDRGGRSPSWIPQANATARAFAESCDGIPLNTLMESVGNLSVTAHILGGAVMSAGPGSGVIDTDHQVHGCPGLYVVDGSAIPANVGVNPSLTITALAERFAERFPVAPESCSPLRV